MLQLRWTVRRLVKRWRVWYLLWRDGNRCHYCWCELVRGGQVRGRQLTIDHVVPKSRGGTDQLANLVLACVTCNNRKGSSSASEYLRSTRLARRRATIWGEDATARG